jgi:MgsA AAA+ ATPase C terminal
MPRDRWILTSLLQKAIRRGHVDYAVAAADSLVVLEPDYVAGRLPIIAYEDIGVADLTTLLWTKQVAATIPVQAGAERRRIATTIAGRLADSPKSRTACDIMCLTDCSPEVGRYADELSRRGFTDWIDAAAATTQPLIRRAVAWRFILGLSAGGKRPNVAVSGGRQRALATVAEAMQLPTVLVAAIHAGTGTHNLQTALALAHELVYSTSDAAIIRGNTSLVSGRVARGVMLCVLDMYTRAGRTAYRRVLSSAPRLMAMLHRYAPRGDPVECIGMLMFHAEGSLLSRRLESAASLAVQVEVENAEAISVGFESPEGALRVREWLHHHQQLIDDARARVIGAAQTTSSPA